MVFEKWAQDETYVVRLQETDFLVNVNFMFLGLPETLAAGGEKLKDAKFVVEKIVGVTTDKSMAKCSCRLESGREVSFAQRVPTPFVSPSDAAEVARFYNGWLEGVRGRG
ncbi:hypothetical protein IKZ40_09585 [bacterium]|nr:hypothetical protein [bacterium]